MKYLLRADDEARLKRDFVYHRPAEDQIPRYEAIYIDNIQPLCLSCNLKKHDKEIDYRTKYDIAIG
jgi:5-methylcytosine-specific restriction endonuclease McrA